MEDSQREYEEEALLQTIAALELRIETLENWRWRLDPQGEQ